MTLEEHFRLNMSYAIAEIPMGSFILYILLEYIIPRDNKRLILLLIKAI
jgi:hypothetical protein